MQRVQIYLLTQTLQLQVASDGTLLVENKSVYSQPLVAYQGINNPIQIQVRNAEQRRVDISGLTFQVDLLRTPDRDLVTQATATTVNASQGLAEFQLSAAALNPLTPGFYILLVKYWDNTDFRIGYINDHYGIEIPIQVLPGYRVTGDVYDLGETLDLGSLPELVDEIRDLGEL